MVYMCVCICVCISEAFITKSYKKSQLSAYLWYTNFGQIPDVWHNHSPFLLIGLFIYLNHLFFLHRKNASRSFKIRIFKPWFLAWLSRYLKFSTHFLGLPDLCWKVSDNHWMEAKSVCNFGAICCLVARMVALIFADQP